MEKEQLGKVISFINMKGGVGKTTLTINIGNELAEKNKKVLIVDMDPQFNATQSLLLYRTRLQQIELDTTQASTPNPDTPTQKEKSESDAEKEVKQEIKSSEEYKKLSDDKQTILQIFENASVSKPRENKSLAQKIKENLYLIPGDLLLAQEISGDTSNKVSALLKHFQVNNLLKEFNYILIDCPPTWSILTHSSLVASDFYVIPSKVDLYSSIGIELLEEQIEKKITNEVMYQALAKNLKRLGIIFTLVHKTVKAEEGRIAKLKADFKDIEFFTSDLPHMPSIPTKFNMFEEANGSSTYTQLTNSIDRITNELEGKINEWVKGHEKQKKHEDQ
ncbi:hypothetical protein CN982_18320 [Bacillus cereus]|uniref:ParA family protein n=1 Tax=Bacillus cereus TaxID=1396 RepID=UPI000BFC154B|nr:AAA family ATPase [Bacillus cereus]PGO26293.1 hypothetical protein CN982_18320 [Bacillus cereus]